MRIPCVLTALAALVGCGESRTQSPDAPNVPEVADAADASDVPDVSDAPAPAASSSRVRFDLGDGAPLAFGAVPFPSELYRGVDGRIALGAWPSSRSDQPLFAAVRELLSSRSGFCGTGNVTFAIDGDLDPTSLPRSAEPGQAAGLDDGIVLVDVDAGSVVPLRVQWDVTSGFLTVRPVRGYVLRAGHRHIAAVTSKVRGADGLPLAAAPQLAALRNTRDGDARLRAAADVIGPALDALEALGLDRARVVGLAAFTPEDPTMDLRAVRLGVQKGAPPSATVDAVWSGAALDALLGIPGEDRPGIDVPPRAGTEGTASIPHATTAVVVSGHFLAPRFVAGEGTEIGAVLREPGGTDRVPFVLIVPRGVDLGRLPVVISHHGFNASRTTGFALADTAGRAGFAVLAIDAYQHGARAASATDEVNSMRGGVAGPDGFAEAAQLDVSARVFGIAGADPGLILFPGYPLGAFLQFAADSMSAVRLVREGDLAALRAADPALATLAFDPSRIAFVGNSMGAVVGTAVAVAEPDVGAVVLNVMPGSIVDTLVESAEFRPLTESLIAGQIGVDRSFDERALAMSFDPTVDLWRWALQPVDPLALAPHLNHEGATHDLLIQLAGQDEVAAPAASESVVAAAGIPGHGAFAFAAVNPVALPAVGNINGNTVAAVRFDGAMHGMLEVSRQVSSWQPPLVPPLVRREMPLEVDNPVSAVHQQIERFLGSFRQDGRATIDVE